MIKFSWKNKKYKIPSRWSELTYQQWKKLQKTEDNNEVLSILSGMSLDMIKRLDDKSLYNLSYSLSWIEYKLDIDQFEPPKTLTIKNNRKNLSGHTIELPLIEDIRNKTFGQKIYFNQLISDNQDDIYNYMVDIILIYNQPIIDKSKLDINRFDELRLSFEDLFLVDLYATAIYYIEQLKEIIGIESKVLASEPSSDQIAAGVDRFKAFGVMNTIRALAGGDILKYEAVEQIEYNLAFTHMAMSKAQNDFQEDYREVMKRKTKNRGR